MAGGSHGPVVKNLRRASSLVMLHLPTMDCGDAELALPHRLGRRVCGDNEPPEKSLAGGSLTELP